MSGSKHFDKIAWTAIALVLVITILFMNGGAFGLEVKARTMGYENRLFDNTRVHTIDIVMDDWEEFIDNATSEEYYVAAMVIDGEAYKNVAIRGKGNTSLSSVSSMGSERYSFKVEFDHYDNSMTYHGLDKLSLNNLIQDSTMMKDYLTYTMMYEFGAAAPLCGFAYITVNGEDWGLYLAVEGIEDSFLTRNYGSGHGELYKPDSMSFGGGRGNGKDFNMDDFMSRSESESGTAQDKGTSGGESFDPSTMFGGDMGGFGMGSSDVKLQYIDDNIGSYSNIWNNAKTDITEKDQTRLIESLRKLSNGEDIESVVDVEQVIRYFVVHNYVCNGDSYTGSMIHNYYLYEQDGQLAMLPWDYNLAYGTFQGGNGQSTVNTPIDAPVSGGAGTDRPMWSWILSDESYTEMYHQYFAEFLNTVDVQAIIDNAYDLIKSYVEKDPTAFYSYEEFEQGVETLRSFCALRSESISMQLENGQTTSNMSYVDASGLTLSDMGSMGGGMGGNKGGFGGDRTGTSGDRTNAGGSAWTKPEGTTSQQSGRKPQGTASAVMPEGMNMSQIPGDFGNMFGGSSTGDAETAPSEGTDSTGKADNAGSAGSSTRPSRDNAQMPNGNFGSSGTPAASGGNVWIWLIVSVAILGVGLVIAKVYRY